MGSPVSGGTGGRSAGDGIGVELLDGSGAAGHGHGKDCASLKACLGQIAQRRASYCAILNRADRASVVDVASVILELFMFAFLVFSAVSLYFGYMKLAFERSAVVCWRSCAYVEKGCTLPSPFLFFRLLPEDSISLPWMLLPSPWTFPLSLPWWAEIFHTNALTKEFISENSWVLPTSMPSLVAEEISKVPIYDVLDRSSQPNPAGRLSFTEGEGGRNRGGVQRKQQGGARWGPLEIQIVSWSQKEGKRG
ncbi:hypothetical protein MA16_Dca023164 [Dendrobium catenatum]|uniref:Uncharacterized protein n=1 Tax=Dendrobium catenatum TaxID=906689 RepID=A0A2I0VUG5_9ASPA|nr:hypothetical protein MA16_Dca023164 [Dendrobium catenatum]